MFINYLDLFSVEISGEVGATVDFIKEEFGDYVGSSPTNELTINIIFVKDRMDPSDYVVREPVSYDEMGVYIFDQSGRKARIDFQSLGSKISFLRCDPDFHPPFFAILFEYFAYLQTLQREMILCHASGVVYEGRTIIFPAWRNIGKTNTLLSFMFDGASYLADDWCLLDEHKTAYRVPKRLHLFDYNFNSFPSLIDRVDPSIAPLAQFYHQIVDGQYDIKDKVLAEIKNLLRVRVNPLQLFPGRVTDSTQKVDYVFMLTKNVKHKERGVYIEPLSRDTLILKMMEILKFEHRPFRLAYEVYKARTGMQNALLEEEMKIFKKRANIIFSDMRLFELFTPGQTSSQEAMHAIKGVVKEANHAF